MLRRRLHDALGRALRLSCASTFTVPVNPGEPIVTHRCQGRHGHDGMHADQMTAWGPDADDSAYPTQRITLRLSELHQLLHAYKGRVADLEHVVMVLARTGAACDELADLLAGQWSEAARTRALELHGLWHGSVEHLITCQGIAAHEEPV